MVSQEFPSVSVIIPARDASATLPGAISAIEDQTYPEIVEIVVAAADPATTEAAARAGVVVVDNPEGTTPAGLNAALAAGKGDVVVRCDAHATLPPGYVARAVETLLRTGADNVGGMQVPVGESDWERAIAAAMSSPLGAGDSRHRIGGEEGPAETVYLGVFRRDTLERLGGYDERFLRNQDYELNHRIIASGGMVWFDPELAVTYRPRGSLRALAHQYFLYGSAKRLFSRVHPGSLRWRQLAPPLLVLVLVGSLVTSIWYPVTLVIPVAYGVALLIAGIGTRANALRTAAALATLHLYWGMGFLSQRR